MPAERLASVIAACRQVLGERPSGLFVDIDGTLSPIAPTPEEAFVPSGIKDALRALALSVDVVMAVTGRGVEDARQLVGVDEIGYVGNHGLERWENGRVRIDPTAEPYIPRVIGAARRLAMDIRMDGLRFEEKGASAAVHYRLAADPLAARSALLQAIARSPDATQLRVTEGRMVINLLPPLKLDKGEAVGRVIAERGLQGVLFVGDDVTDIDAVRVVHELRERRRLRGLTVAVRSPEGPPELFELADFSVDGVDQVENLLEALADRRT